MYSITIYLTVSVHLKVMSDSGFCFQTAKPDVIPSHRHILKHDGNKQLIVSPFQNDLVMRGRMAKTIPIQM